MVFSCKNSFGNMQSWTLSYGMSSVQSLGYGNLEACVHSCNQPDQASIIEIDGKNKWKTIIQNASLSKNHQ